MEVHIFSMCRGSLGRIFLWTCPSSPKSWMNNTIQTILRSDGKSGLNSSVNWMIPWSCVSDTPRGKFRLDDRPARRTAIMARILSPQGTSPASAASHAPWFHIHPPENHGFVGDEIYYFWDHGNKDLRDLDGRWDRCRMLYANNDH